MTLLPSKTQYLLPYHELVEKGMTDHQVADEENLEEDETGDAETALEHVDEELETVHAGADHQQECSQQPGWGLGPDTSVQFEG